MAGVLKTLAVTNSEEQQYLETLLSGAIKASQGILSEGYALLSSLPADLQQYFYGLVEALEIYRSLHGVPVTVQDICAAERVHELKQIRDYCLSDSLRSIF